MNITKTGVLTAVAVVLAVALLCVSIAYFRLSSEHDFVVENNDADFKYSLSELVGIFKKDGIEESAGTAEIYARRCFSRVRYTSYAENETLVNILFNLYSAGDEITLRLTTETASLLEQYAITGFTDESLGNLILLAVEPE